MFFKLFKKGVYWVQEGLNVAGAVEPPAAHNV